jgi:DNA polymerase
VIYILFYDFEVFKYDWLVVVKDTSTRTTYEIVNSPDELNSLYEKSKKEIWCGFNSRHYDQYILKGILCRFDPKKVSDYIIAEGNPGWKFAPAMFRNIPLLNYDVMLGTASSLLRGLWGMI